MRFFGSKSLSEPPVATEADAEASNAKTQLRVAGAAVEMWHRQKLASPSLIARSRANSAVRNELGGLLSEYKAILKALERAPVQRSVLVRAGAMTETLRRFVNQH